MLKEKIIIGIDPDVTKNGVAVKCKTFTKLSNLTFFELFDLLLCYKETRENIEVYIECGFLNKSNWHKVNGNNSVNAQIGQRTGANHEVAKKIVEMCEYLQITFFKVKPTRSKTNAEFFKQITKIGQRTNQEQRDAYMLIYNLK